jgi:transposase InsO family protein
MMMDDEVVAVSPSSVYRILDQAGLLRKWNSTQSAKGSGFAGPSRPHEHWHIDISYLNIMGTFFYLICLLDGYSRTIVHWDIREQMTEIDVGIVVHRAKEKYPETGPRIISDNGPQFIAKDFKELIRTLGMSHVLTSAYYPQSNGKIERFHQTAKRDCIRPKTPLSLDEARQIVDAFIEFYNRRRLHSAIGYVTPQDKLQGREKAIFAERDRKLARARANRKAKRQASTTQGQGPAASQAA